MSVIIDRLMSRETVSIEAQSGTFDGQGKPGFSAGVDVDCGVIRSDKYVIDPEGAKILTPLTLYVPPDGALTPGDADRVTLSGGDVFTVIEVTAPRRIGAARGSTTADHTRARCVRGG